VDVIAEILTYVDYIAFSERLRKAQFTEDTSEEPLTCRLFHGKLKLDVLALSKEVLGYTNIWYESALNRSIICLAERPINQGDHSSLLPGYQNGSIPGTWTDGFPGKPRSGRLCRRDRWKEHDTQRDCRFSKRCSRVSRRSSKKPFERISFSRCSSGICSGSWARPIDPRTTESTDAIWRITAVRNGEQRRPDSDCAAVYCVANARSLMRPKAMRISRQRILPSVRSRTPIPDFEHRAVAARRASPQ
jgi:hypothetical protein